MARKDVLGKIFYDVYNDNSLESGKGNGEKIRIADIEPRHDQPRKTFDREALEALAESIAEHGVLQPIIVRENEAFAGTYEIIAGERRYRAAKIAGLTEIPAVVLSGDDLKVAEVALIENIQREDLNPVEEALGYGALIEKFGLTQEQVAKQVGKSRSAVANMLRLLDLPDAVLEMLKNGDISAGHARALLGLKNKDSIVDTAEQILVRSLSVRDTEALVKKLNKEYEKGLLPEEEKNGDEIEVDYIKDLEKKAMYLTGKRVKIKQKGKVSTVEIDFYGNDDLEDILVKLCGKSIIEG